jgi:hypothetical protein
MTVDIQKRRDDRLSRQVDTDRIVRSVDLARPTRTKRVPWTRNAEFSMGVLPSPTTSRALSNKVTLCPTDD